MTTEEIKSQLRELIDDRQSLKSGKYCDAVDNEIYDKDIAALTEAIKAIDRAEPVKHGQWIRVIGDNYECSECKAAVWTNLVHPITNYKFCWRCGAKMKGDKK